MRLKHKGEDLVGMIMIIMMMMRVRLEQESEIEHTYIQFYKYILVYSLFIDFIFTELIRLKWTKCKAWEYTRRLLCERNIGKTLWKGSLIKAKG